MNHRLTLREDGTAVFEGSAEEILASIRRETEQVARELVEVSGLVAGQILVVGCSSSEVTGNRIGKASVLPVAEAICDGLMPILAQKGIFLAAQCCEHLNRAIIVQRTCAERYGLEPVSVRPMPKAGGSFATTVYDRFDDPVAVEHIAAHAGLDIGGTLIGMHLKHVAVPVRLSVSKIGDANILCARTRPKYIGGPRACYE